MGQLNYTVLCVCVRVPWNAGGIIGVLAYKYVYQEGEDRTMMFKVDMSIRKHLREHNNTAHGGAKKEK
jgi:hypothetical protein